MYDRLVVVCRHLIAPFIETLRIDTGTATTDEGLAAEVTGRGAGLRVV
jgi:hypothetical protein